MRLNLCVLDRAVSSRRLVPGDVVVLLRGKATCDMVLLRGSCLIEESILSGEASLHTNLSSCCLCICSSVRLFVCLFVCLCVHQSGYLRLRICMYIHPSACLSDRETNRHADTHTDRQTNYVCKAGA